MPDYYGIPALLESNLQRELGWAIAYSIVEFPPLAIPVVFLISAVNVSSRIVVPGVIIPRVFASVPLAVVGHGDGEKSSKNERQTNTNTFSFRPSPWLAGTAVCRIRKDHSLNNYSRSLGDA